MRGKQACFCGGGDALNLNWHSWFKKIFQIAIWIQYYGSDASQPPHVLFFYDEHCTLSASCQIIFSAEIINAELCTVHYDPEFATQIKNDLSTISNNTVLPRIFHLSMSAVWEIQKCIARDTVLEFLPHKKLVFRYKFVFSADIDREKFETENAEADYLNKAAATHENSAGGNVSISAAFDEADPVRALSPLHLKAPSSILKESCVTSPARWRSSFVVTLVLLLARTQSTSIPSWTLKNAKTQFPPWLNSTFGLLRRRAFQQKSVGKTGS